MSRKPESRGTCAYCGEIIYKRSIKRHLEKCPGRLEVIQAAETSTRPVEKLWHLRIQDAHARDFWLHLEMRGSSSLKTLDTYLRSIWLECCGHLSEFVTGGWGGDTVGMSRKADAVFKSLRKLDHHYDFGTTSETEVHVIGSRTGKATTKRPIALLARNNMPEALCQECGEPAGWFCTECLYEDEGPGFLCAEHAEDHPHVDYGEPVELVNSPRLGMCGYTGPANPPY